MRRLGSMLAAVWLLAAAPSTQSPRTATIDAIVSDRDGRPIAGLTAADFRVVGADGAPIPVTGVREVAIPLNSRGKATAAADAPIEATNQHAREARLFVVITEPLFYQTGVVNARAFVDELAAGLTDDDAIALFVSGSQHRWLPPTSDMTLVARAFNAIPQARAGFEIGGMTLFARDELPKIFQSLMRTQWAQRTIIWLTPGAVGPEALRDYKNWNAWAQRANAPMHAVDPLGGSPGGGQGFGMMDQPLLRQAATETGGELFLNRSSMKGLATKIIATTEHFYEVQVDVPAAVKTDQSFYTTVRTHPTSKTRARLRLRVPEISGLSAHATNELTNALSAALPMDELPLALSLESTVGATAATLTFPRSGREPFSTIELPAGPLTVAFAAVTDAGKMLALGSRVLAPDDLRIEGCCATTRTDIVIPKNAVSVRAAVFQQPTGRVGSVFLPIERQ